MGTRGLARLAAPGYGKVREVPSRRTAPTLPTGRPCAGRGGWARAVSAPAPWASSAAAAAAAA
eukprot:CAMPEP_0204552050 /NCGR_PEP_ID=MMETSP0661-20131031/26348_1 /ASSEMBLY_ACC=CAM_ASM_000606 /TAXON_ID=109239 /ORGANISM="Alexandrium margalefi, Strain AMGDE01CS-322" /LENGTH=62 /DNA_ID=CAMNT_0051559049 /DNA_START=71 /DNA_END=256 /DNA_ORIENTATION=-